VNFELNDRHCARCERPNPEPAGSLPLEWEVLTDQSGELGVICDGCITPGEQQAIDQDMMGMESDLPEDEPTSEGLPFARADYLHQVRLSAERGIGRAALAKALGKPRDWIVDLEYEAGVVLGP
jgi:hypothetical protein